MNHTIPISPNTSILFDCSKEVPCFNHCCRDLNQFLTPYDILRLKNHLGIPSSIFLEQYTCQHTGPETGLPVITLKPNDSLLKKCPFIADSGCTVYEDRPSSCRMYPFARAISRSRETGKISEHFILLKEPHCRGFEKGTPQTAVDWIKNQGLVEYNLLNDMMMDIISLKNRLRPGQLDIKSSHLFYLALYDLDDFRTHISDKNILDGFESGSGQRDNLEYDDTELLKTGLRWIRHVLFNSLEP